jgi:hypothetical protein
MKGSYQYNEQLWTIKKKEWPSCFRLGIGLRELHCQMISVTIFSQQLRKMTFRRLQFAAHL